MRVQWRADVEDVHGTREVDEERVEREEPPGAYPARNLLAVTSAARRNTTGAPPAETEREEGGIARAGVDLAVDEEAFWAEDVRIGEHGGVVRAGPSNGGHRLSTSDHHEQPQSRMRAATYHTFGITMVPAGTKNPRSSSSAEV